MTLNTDRPTETLNREELIQMAIRTARSGNKQSAVVMFQRVLNEDPRNERALLWMGALATDPKEKRRFLLKTLKVNPKNKTAREELQRMAHSEKASANRTLIYGGLIIVGVLIVIAVLVVVMVLLGVLG